MRNDVITFGCRLNIYESEIIRNNIKKSNLENVVVINTCAVTQEAEKQAKQCIRKIRREDPNVKIIVTGCAAQNNPDLFSSMVEVDKVLGNEEKLDYKNYHIGSFGDLTFENNENRVLVNDIMSVNETAHQLVTDFQGKTRAFIQIQNGCNHRCTFCIIPYGRGNSRSTPIGAISEQIKLLLKNGYSEIVLTGVDVTDYGSNLPGKPTLAQLIRRLFGLNPDLKRIRLSSIDVAEIDTDLFDLMAKEARLMPHFHISLQAGDDMILKRMKRRHTREQVIDFCNSLRKIRPEVAFGADIITGFPTETDEMFGNTLDLVKKANLQYLHVFPYSKREGTPATKMPQVEGSKIKSRAKMLRELGVSQLDMFFKKHDNSYSEVLMESLGNGHTNNFIPVKYSNESKDSGDVEDKVIVMKLSYNGSNGMVGYSI